MEGALTALARQGVYVAIDEFKGRRETVRGSLRVTFEPRDFDNPFIKPHLILYTGGSGRRPSRVRYSLAFLEEWAVSISLTIQAHGVDAPHQVFWWPVPLAHTIMAGLLGHPIAGWFYPLHPLPTMAPWAARYLTLLGRLAGSRFPRPQHCDLQTPERLSTWLTEQLGRDRQLVVWATPSACARLGLAATGAGQTLRGVTFLATGEAVTEARRRQAEVPGARVMAVYSSVDVSAPAYGCATPTDADDLHVMLDRCALICRSRPATTDGPMVDALLATALSPAAPKIALNTETGDYGRLEEHDCGCLFGALGLRHHLSDIRSFEKLTGEGVTFTRTDVQRILEEVLPGRFGGTSLDYQLAEEEAPSGATRLVLRVSPSAGDLDEADLRATLLAEIGRSGPSDQYNVDLWRSVGTLDIRRDPPLPTRAGKVLPFQLLQRPGGAARTRF